MSWLSARFRISASTGKGKAPFALFVLTNGSDQGSHPEHVHRPDGAETGDAIHIGGDKRNFAGSALRRRQRLHRFPIKSKLIPFNTLRRAKFPCVAAMDGYLSSNVISAPVFGRRLATIAFIFSRTLIFHASRFLTGKWKTTPTMAVSRLVRRPWTGATPGIRSQNTLRGQLCLAHRNL